jgi:molybdopterin-guanine dinucleotide biosynthesis protein A
MAASDRQGRGGAGSGCVLGVLAGGRGSRMGGRDKALLRAESGETILARLVRLAGEAELPVVVAGGPARPGLCVVPDDPPGIGPLGGLRALLAYAGARPLLVLGCDMPYVTRALLERLARAPRTGAAVLAARDAATRTWQPLFARYDAPRALASLDAALAGGVRSFQAWFAALPVEELALAAGEHALLRDWDEPSDVPGDVPSSS